MGKSTGATIAERDDTHGAPDSGSLKGRSSDDFGGIGGPPSRRRLARRGFFEQYKPEQGRYTRVGTFVAAGALVAWGAFFIYERLQVYQGDDWFSLMITTGIPIVFAAVLGALAWWACFSARASSDFMIATEGEMKKVNWSSRREIIGSTKVVILFTIVMAVFLFVVDIIFQVIFSWLGVLK
jgi:preprotein translocase subunit SecE